MKNTQLPAHARVVKAHGAGNSFVVATDQYDDYDPSEVEVRHVVELTQREAEAALGRS